MKKVAAGTGNHNKDIVSIQALRGIAAFLVVLVHCFPFDYYPSTNILRIISDEGEVGVQIFFIISGYIVPYSMFKKNYELKDIRIFFAKRMIRIEPPYVASIVLILLLNWLTAWSPWTKGAATQYDWWNIIGHLGYLNAFTKQPWLNPVYWTLALEFMYYLIIALFFQLLTSSNKWILRLSFYIFLSLSFTQNHFPYYLLEHQTVFFTLGIALFLFHVQKINLTEYIVFTLSCLCVCYLKFPPLLLFVAVAALLFIQYVNYIPKILWGLGAISYSLYLTHAFIITRVVGLLGRFIPSLPVSIKYTIGILGCLIFATGYYFVVERPFQQLSRKIGYKGKEVESKMIK
jgi:peptidoglycan/LPS O-acetylase OafA/YrhL